MTLAISGTTGITLAGQFDSASTFGYRNRIINGGMVIDQRNAGASGTAIGYTVDRFQFAASLATKGTWQQNAGSVTPPVGFSNYLGFTSNSAYSVSATDYFVFRQPIEGFNFADFSWGTANAKAVTVSFWVRSSLTGTFCANFSNSAGSRAYPATYTISSANTWEQKTVTVAGDITGTWVGSTNGVGLYLDFSMGVGTTYSGTANAWNAGLFLSATGAVSVVGTNGATFYITGVQLEKGSTATSFDFRDYGTELALCQRYCYVITTNVSQVPLCTTANYSSTNAFGVLPFPVTMRGSPTTTFVNPTNWNVTGNGTAIAATLSQGNVTQYATEIITTCTGLTVGYAGWIRSNGVSTNQIINSAEL